MRYEIFSGQPLPTVIRLFSDARPFLTIAQGAQLGKMDFAIADAA